MRITGRPQPPSAGLLPASLPFFGACWLLSSINFALAAELPLGSTGQVELENAIPHEQPNELRPEYEPEFGVFDRSIIGRQAGNSNPIEKDTPVVFNIEPGTSRCYALSREDLLAEDDDDDSERRNELRDLEHASGGNGSGSRRVRRQAPSEVMVSATTCLQPTLSNDEDAPQLRLLAAKPGATQCPEWMPREERPGEDDPNYYEEYAFEEGLVFESLTAPEDGPLYVSIYAPEISEDFEDLYNFELVMSTNNWYHRYVDTKELLWMDSDSSAALLLTHSLTDSLSDTERILKRDPPFEVYVEDIEKPAFKGIERSLCGIEKKALISANKDGNGRQHDLVRTSMTTRGGGDLARQQFYFEGLTSSSKYRAILVQVADASEYDNFFPGESKKRQENTSGRQMTIFEPTDFETLTGTTCKVITDLDFCTETQHAVPGNNDLEGPELARIYDDYAREMYSHFEKIMMQIPCEADSTSKYSLTRTCDDCKDAYKRWLCTVVIPRCEDWSSNNTFAVPRNVGQPFPNGTFVDELEENRDKSQTMTSVPGYNASRNAFIDEEIAPGPYKEVLPCHELCYEVVQNCPASLGFSCPLKGMTAFEYSYGTSESAPFVTCQYPGQPRTRFAGSSRMAPSMMITLSVASLGIWMAAS